MKPDHVHFRLSHKAWVQHSTQALAQDLDLGSNLRLRVEQQDGSSPARSPS